MKPDELILAPELLAQAPTTEGHKNYGRDCYLAANPGLEEVLAELYGRPGLCLKVFRDHSGEYGGVPLAQSARAQNLFAFAGIAPRVYAIVTVNGQIAEVCDYADGSGKPDVKLGLELLKAYNVGVAGYKNPAEEAKRYVAMEFKWVGDKLVDFGRFHLLDPEGYAERLRKLAQRRHRGKGGALVGYQAVPELHVPGQRDHRHRVKHMQLDGLDFHGKTVLDIGCNLGVMCREAVDRGAKRVVGVDWKRCEIWREVNNWLGYWNIDIVQATLPAQVERIWAETGTKQFDIVFALAIVQHMDGGYQPWIADLTKEVLYLEGDRLPKGTKTQSGWEPDFRQVEANTGEQYSEVLRRDFQEVEWLGWIKDEDRRALYRCWQIPRPAWGELPEGIARKAEAIRRGQSIFGRVLMWPEELAFLYDLAAKAPDGPACEVGCFNGSSLVTWASARQGRGQVSAIDIIDRLELRKNILHSGYLIDVVIGKSWEAAADLEPQAFAFVDADHTQTGIPRDIKVYTSKVMPGGIIAFHDYDKKEAAKGKGYVVYATVNAWQKRARWEPLGQAGRVIAFRRPA